ncbi:MAG: hypothetical protein ABFD54_05645 [Armatimonadota bacterium]|nr:hypothetical protein [bacterium]
MKLDKKQTIQLVVLGVLVIICIGYVSFSAMNSHQAPPQPVKQASEKTETVETNTATVAAAPTSVFPDLASVPARRDPFAPVALPMEQTVENNMNVSPAPKPFPTRRVQAKPIKLPVGKVPRVPANPFNPFSQLAQAFVTPSTSSSTAPVVVQAKDPEFMLMGVVRGERNVAIIRTSAGGRYVVKQGQLIDGRYKVESVSYDSATLVCESRRIHLKLGGV